MSKGCRFVILGEDESHLRFAEKFLIERGVAKPRDIFLKPVPAGQGSGEQFVRSHFPVELKAIRGSSQFQRKYLLVLIDGDTATSAERRQQLAQACEAAGVPPPHEQDAIGIFIPRRNIQTWIKCLLGIVVDEKTDYKRLTPESDRRKAAIALAEQCRTREIGDEAPPSLQDACREFNRLNFSN